MFALECAMDEIAAKLSIDPVELRIKNDADLYPGKNVRWSSRHLVESLRLGADKLLGPSSILNRALSRRVIG
jgi:xanthine dehydrogenase YagR molybdenum-binding subunit